MRELTFKGFLAQYVKRLSKFDTNSLYKLAEEASSDNARLREPLFLFALYSGKQTVLLQATKDQHLFAEYQKMVSQYSAQQMTQMFEDNDSVLPNEYHKVWRSFQSQKNRGQSDDHTKELMRLKVKRLQEQYGVSNYRIYTDLQLNPGNVNAWLKHGVADKVSLDTARRTLRYVEGYLSKN
ncbi:MAG: transcriptional regulator [Oscillospiraceae bacterium]|nr:transcriptional regulator [Oscillospiraceae bacterium]